MNSGIQPIVHSDVETLEQSRLAFVARCDRDPLKRRRETEALDLLIQWSLRRSDVLAFRPAGELEQVSITFVREAEGTVFWKTYVQTGMRKLEILPRIRHSAEFDALLLKVPGMNGKSPVPRLPLYLIADPKYWGPVEAALQCAHDNP